MIAPFGAIDASRSRPLSVDPASTWRTGADVWVATEVPLVAPWAGELTVAPSGLVLTGEDATLRITADEGMPGSEPTSVSLGAPLGVLRPGTSYRLTVVTNDLESDVPAFAPPAYAPG